MQNLKIKLKLTYKSSVLEDILVGMAIILAGYFYYYENRRIIYNIENPENINHAIKITIGVIIVVTWLFLSFQNGVKKRRSFLICTLCLWILPQIAKYYIDTFVTMSSYELSLQRSFALLAQYLSGINYLSLKTLGDSIYNNTGIPYYITLNVIILLFEVMFVAGYLTGKRFNNTEDKTNGANVKDNKTTEINDEEAEKTTQT